MSGKPTRVLLSGKGLPKASWWHEPHHHTSKDPTSYRGLPLEQDGTHLRCPQQESIGGQMCSRPLFPVPQHSSMKKGQKYPEYPIIGVTPQIGCPKKSSYRIMETTQPCQPPTQHCLLWAECHLPPFICCSWVPREGIKTPGGAHVCTMFMPRLVHS